MRRVKVNLPKAQGGMNVGSNAGMGTNSADAIMPAGVFTPGTNGTKEETRVNKTVEAAPRELANLEAEKGETVVTNLSKGGIPEFYNIGGKRHYDGGTPLNLPADSFIFSRDIKLKINDPDILAQFGKNVKKKNKGFTPADLSKQYNLNKYQQILMDPNSTKMDIDTAERMITNYNLKLGGLAMVQESMKGFPDGIPGIAMPYLAATGIDPKELIQIPGQEQQGAPQGPPMAQYGGVARSNNAKEPQGGSMSWTRFPSLGPNAQYQFGGGTGSQRRVRVSMPKYQGGGGTGETPVASTSNKKTSYQNIPKGSVKWDITKDGYDETKVQPGDYIKKEDGKWYKATGYTTKDYDFKDERLGDLQGAYGHLQNTLTSNPELQNAVYANYQKHIEEGQLSDKEKERLLAIPQEQVISNFLQGEKQVYAINSSGMLYEKDADGKIVYEDGKPKMKSEKDLKSWETTGSEEYKKNMKSLGFNDDELFGGMNTAMFQAAYRGLQDASRDEQFTETLANFNLTPIGLKDSHGMHTYDDKPISPVDKFFGNTTAGQAVLPKELDQDLSTEEVEWTDADQQPEAVKHLPEIQQADPAKWWTEDIVATAGAAGDFFRREKFSPWQAKAATKLVNPTFMDPTRQLAANAELANISTQGAATFSGPQAFNARAAQIQGKAAQNVANTISGVHNQNVQIANQFEMANADIMNRASDRNAQLATQLWDKNTIANQQFKNEKDMARQNLRQSWINGWTNKGQTQTMNSLYDQYSVDPTTGYTTFTGGRKITPKTSNQSSVMDKAAGYKRMNPGWDDAAYVQMAKADAGIPGGSPGGAMGANPAAFAYPGGVPNGYYGG